MPDNKIIRKLRAAQLEKPSLSQSRVGTNPETIEKYKALWKSGEADFPPIIVYEDMGKYYIADGFHRAQSLMLADLDRKLEHRTIECEVRSGTIRDAIVYSLGANLKHGLLPSTADKKRAILLYYGLSVEHCAHSNNAVAKACGCSHTFVGNWKATCISTPAYITATETKIPTAILKETIKHLTAAVAEGKIVTTRNGKELKQAQRANPEPLEPSSTVYIVTATNSAIPRGTLVEGWESLTNSGNVVIDCGSGSEIIAISDLIEIPFAKGTKLTEIDRQQELIVTAYSLVGDDLKIHSIDDNGFTRIHSSTVLRPFIKKTLENPVVVPNQPENKGVVDHPTTPILNLLSLTDSELNDLQVAIESEIERRGTPQD